MRLACRGLATPRARGIGGFSSSVGGQPAGIGGGIGGGGGEGGIAVGGFGGLAGNFGQGFSMNPEAGPSGSDPQSAQGFAAAAAAGAFGGGGGVSGGPGSTDHGY